MPLGFHYPQVARLSGFLILLAALCLFTGCKKRASTPLWPAAETPILSNEPAENLAEPQLKFPSPAPPDANAAPTRFLVYNLRNYLSMPRLMDGESRMLPKPEHEIQALIKNIVKAAPDVIGMCEIGTQADLDDLQKRLVKAGINLPYHHLAGGSDPYRRLAILSRYPLQPHPRPDIHYRMNGHTHISNRGIIDVSIQLPSGIIRLLGVHLKSKRPVDGKDEALIRRNEAMVLRRHIDRIFSKNPQTALLVYGDINDTKQSAAVRSIAGALHSPSSLKPLNLKATDGTNWTHHWIHEDIYSRIDYIFASPGILPRINQAASHLLDTPAHDPASDHRGMLLEIR